MFAVLTDHIPACSCHFNSRSRFFTGLFHGYHERFPVCFRNGILDCLQKIQRRCMKSVHSPAFPVDKRFRCLLVIIYVKLLIDQSFRIQLCQGTQCLLHLRCRTAVNQAALLILHPIGRVCMVCVANSLYIKLIPI